MTGLYFFLFLWILTAVAGILALIRIHRKKLNWNFKLTALLLVFMLILIMRMTVNLFASFDPGTDTMTQLSPVERILDSFVHSFQTFSMDEDYTDYTGRGKELFLEAFGPGMAAGYGFFISLLNILAPVMGGAVLLEILTGVFPRLKLTLRPRRRKLIFSEVNKESVTLAEDLMRDGNYSRIMFWESAYRRRFHLKPVPVFTDAYADEESEVKSELYERLKKLGAICVKTDLQCLPLGRSLSAYYFLMDENEEKNISAAAGLLDGDTLGRIMWPRGEEQDRLRTRVFAFCQSDHGLATINTICGGREDLMVRPIRDYTNAAVNLLYEVPLFLPLLHGETESYTGAETDSSENTREPFGRFLTERDADGRIGGLIPERGLHVTILGCGDLAGEIFKAVYWVGQIGGIQLFIRVLADHAQALRCRLERDCPELFSVCEDRERPASGKTGEDLLRIYPHTSSGLRNAPYAVLEGFTEMEDVLDPERFPEDVLSKTDYYVIVLGEDERNLFAAGQLRRELVKKAMDAGREKHPVIAPAVFDARVARTFTEKDPGPYEPYLLPFGTLDSRFSCKNVFMSDVTADALRSDLLYDEKQHKERRRDEYSYWSNVMRAVHAPYKLFGMGVLTDVDLSAPASERFRGITADIAPDDQAFVWMEHRRWCAYLRTQGFSRPSAEQHRIYFEETGKHKNLDLRLHNCLIESGLRGKELDGISGEDLSRYDALDMAAVEACHMDCMRNGTEETPEVRQASEYKQYDELSRDAAAQKMLERLPL